MSLPTTTRARTSETFEHLLVVVAIAALGVGILMIVNALRAAATGPLLPDPASRQFAVDFRDYWIAAGRMAHGQSPYAPEMLDGPISIIGLDRYRYPPVLAFLLIPLSGLPYLVAGAIWAFVSAAALFAGLALSMKAGGYTLTPRRLLFMSLMAVWFMPTLDMLWKGNVEGLQALLIGVSLAAGARVGTSAIVAGALLKLTPLVLLPAAIVRDPKASFVGAGIILCVLVIPSFLLAPEAYLQMPTVLANIATGDALRVVNMAPVSWLPADLANHAPLVRGATIFVAGLFVVASVIAARRSGGWGAAIACGVIASILAGNVIWFHYTVMLLPLVVFAWPRLSRARRVLVEGCLLATVIGGEHSQIIFALMAIVMTTVLVTIWPQRNPSSPATERQTLA